MTTESSVVVALREVRRLELERQRREEEARKREHEEERAKADAAQRASIQYGPGVAPYVNGPAWGSHDAQAESYGGPPVRRTTEVVPVVAQAYVEAQSVAPPPPGWLEQGMPFRPAPRPRSRVAAALVTLMLCGGAGAVGYWKLSGQWRATQQRLSVENRRLEDQRNEAVAARSKAEQELKVKSAEMQAKLAAATSRVNEAAAAVPPPEARPAKRVAPAGPLPGKRFNRFGNRRMRGGGPRAAQGPAQKAMKPAVKPTTPTAPPGGPEPRVAKKKPMSDDPLGGLRL